MELTNVQFRALTPDAKLSMIYSLLVAVDGLKIDVSILRRELKDLRESQHELGRRKKRKEAKRATSQTV